MRYLILIGFLALSSITFAQNCKLEINDIDPRTKLKIIRTEFEQLDRINSNPLLVKAQAVGDKKFLKIRYYRYNNFEIRSGSEMEFMLSNNKVVTLQPFINPADTAPDENSFMTVSSLIIYPIEDDAFKLLTTYDVVKIKYYVAQGYQYSEIKTKRQSVIREVLNCIK